MTTKTVGTNGTTTLTGFQVTPSMSDTDIATIAQAILDDFALQGANPFARNLFGSKGASNIVPGAFSRNGKLFVPNRGSLQMYPNDWVLLDPTTGWPMLLSAGSMPATLTATGTPITGVATMTMTTNVLSLGWMTGMLLAGTNIATGAVIQSISTDGLTITMSKNATGSPGPTTITASNWTHS